MEAVIELEQVCKRYRAGQELVTAVDAADLRVTAGEFACIYGASGSGKTTLLNVVAGIDTADSGEVTVAGHALSTLDENQRAAFRLRSVGVVFQLDNLLPEFTARENVTIPLRVRGVPTARANVQAGDALARVGLDELADRLPTRMSGGQRQRVGIARALAGDRPLLVADEPTGALDSRNSIELFGLLRSLCDRGTTVLLATHDPLARRFATTEFEMVDGIISPCAVPSR